MTHNSTPLNLDELDGEDEVWRRGSAMSLEGGALDVSGAVTPHV